MNAPKDIETPKAQTEPAEAAFSAARGSASHTDAEITDLKMRLNQIIWEYAPAETTIGDAEDLACKILNAVRAGKYLR